MFQVKSRFTGHVLFECELDAEIAARPFRFQLGFAVRKAVEARAHLTGADLTGADLTGADLRGADLRGADLRDADLTGTVLTGADLTGAVLRGADLRDADLRGADLRDAVLTGTVLRDAVLTGADLRGADLTGADLRRADLKGAVLRDADLREIENDFIAAVLCMPNELEALSAAMTEGRIDGSTYSGPCACLAGTLAHARGIAAYSGGDIGMFVADASSPRERWFMGIRPGDTPETNQVSKIALGWLDRAIAMRDVIRTGAASAGEPVP